MSATITELVTSLQSLANTHMTALEDKVTGMIAKVDDMTVNAVPSIMSSVTEVIPGSISAATDEVANVNTSVTNLQDTVTNGQDAMTADLHTYIDENLDTQIAKKLEEMGVNQGQPVEDTSTPYGAVGGSGEDQFIIDECAKKVRAMILRDLRKMGVIRRTKRAKRVKRTRRARRTIRR